MRMAVSGWKNSDQSDSKHIHMSSYVYDCLCMNNFGSLCFVLYLLILSIQSLSLNMFADVACFSTVVNIVGEGHEQLNLAETKTCLVLISQGSSWVQNHFRHFCLLWQDLIGSSAALCENMGHTYSSMGNYDEAPSDSDRHSTTKESVGLDSRLSDCLLFGLHCFAPWDRWKSSSIGSAKIHIQTITVQTDIQTDWDKGAQKWCIVCGIVFWLFVSSYAQAAKYFQRALKCLDQEVGKKTGDRAGHGPGTRCFAQHDGRWWKMVEVCACSFFFTQIGSNWLLDFRRSWRVIWTCHSHENKR